MRFLNREGKRRANRQDAPGARDGELKVYPALVLTALARKDGSDSALRIWHIARQLSTAEHDGAGVVSLADVRDRCERAGLAVSDHHWRRMLTAGDGVLWDRVKSDGVPVLRLAGLLRVALALGVTDADWKPVLIPADRVRKLKKWRAACFTAWHAGRRGDGPMARATQEYLLSVPERTQRHYCAAESAMTQQSNYAVEKVKATKERIADVNLFGNGGAFTWFDGRLARQMPNTSRVMFDTTRRGMCWKLDARLTDGLLKKPDLFSSLLPTGSSDIWRKYYRDRKSAERAIRRHSKQANGMPSAFAGLPGRLFAESAKAYSGAQIWEVIQ